MVEINSNGTNASVGVQTELGEVGMHTDYPGDLQTDFIPDPQDWHAVSLDQGDARSGLRHAIAACLYERIVDIMWVFCLVRVHLSQKGIAAALSRTFGHGDDLLIENNKSVTVHARGSCNQLFSITFVVEERPLTVLQEQVPCSTIVSYNTDKVKDKQKVRHTVYVRRVDLENKLVIGHNSWGN